MMRVIASTVYSVVGTSTLFFLTMRDESKKGNAETKIVLGVGDVAGTV